MNVCVVGVNRGSDIGSGEPGTGYRWEDGADVGADFGAGAAGEEVLVEGRDSDDALRIDELELFEVTRHRSFHRFNVFRTLAPLSDVLLIVVALDFLDAVSMLLWCYRSVVFFTSFFSLLSVVCFSRRLRGRKKERLGRKAHRRTRHSGTFVLLKDILVGKRPASAHTQHLGLTLGEARYGSRGSTWPEAHAVQGCRTRCELG